MIQVVEALASSPLSSYHADCKYLGEALQSLRHTHTWHVFWAALDISDPKMPCFLCVLPDSVHFFTIEGP